MSATRSNEEIHELLLSFVKRENELAEAQAKRLLRIRSAVTCFLYCALIASIRIVSALAKSPEQLNVGMVVIIVVGAIVYVVAEYCTMPGRRRP